MLVDTLSVAENVALGRSRNAATDRPRSVSERIRELADTYSSTSTQAIICSCRWRAPACRDHQALYRNVPCCLDEPTRPHPREVDELFVCLGR